MSRPCLVTIYTNTATVNDDGQKIEATTESFTCWGKVRGLSGRERRTGGQAISDVTHEVELRSTVATRAITARDRLAINGGTRRLNIVRVYDPDMRNQKIVIEAIEKV